MELQVAQYAGSAASKLNVSEDIFASDYNESLIHQVVVAYLAKARQGSKAQKNRSDVSGGGAKPWRQKGTGRARAGTIRSPIWRSGGVTFAARPRDYSQKVNKRMYRKALHSILSELVRQERLVVVNELKMAEPKTKALIANLKELKTEENSKVLLVTDELDANLELSARNIPYVAVAQASTVDPVSLVAADKVVLTVDAVKKLEERLG